MKDKAPIGIEPMHKGFADLSLTSWVRRRCGAHSIEAPHFCQHCVLRITQYAIVSSWQAQEPWA